MLRRPLVIIPLVVAALLVLAVAGAWIYDAGRKDTIAPGVSVGGVAIGGLSRDAAAAKLRRDLLEPLSQPVVIRHGDRTWRLTAKEAHISADVQASIDAAVARSHTGNFLTRTVRSITGDGLGARLQPSLSYSDAAVIRAVDRVRQALDRPARDAKVDFTGETVAPVPAQSGRAVQASQLHRDINAVIVSPGAERTVIAHATGITPKVTTAELAHRYPTVVTVDRSRFRLTLFKNLRPVKVYRIAVGRAGLETPAGLYAIQDKQVNPAWHVPDSPWAGKLAGKVIPPGPDDPIKARWMGLFEGAGIHGTTEIDSLGSAASHGCVRMAIPDVIQLYDRVRVGTPVYIA